MIYKFNKNRTKEVVLGAINVLILFCRENETSISYRLNDLESELIELEDLIKEAE